MASKKSRSRSKKGRKSRKKKSMDIGAGDLQGPVLKVKNCDSQQNLKAFPYYQFPLVQTSKGGFKTKRNI